MMEQDLFNWLNSKGNNSQGTGLLLAPLSGFPISSVSSEQIEQIEPQLPEIIQPLEEHEQEQEERDDSESLEAIPEESKSQPESLILVDNENPPDTPPRLDLEAESESEAESELQSQLQSQPEEEESEEPEELLKDHEWQERATGFTLSLDEPPPELWTGINDDDEELDYEENDSLQGAAYVQIHGRNFTERLHHTLRHRKERAEERAEAERESAASSHPYFQKSIIFCSTLLMCLAFAWASLWFLDGLVKNSKRVQKNVEQTQTQTQILVSKEPEVQPKPVEIKTVPIIEKPPTFEDYLNEANHAYNIGMYNRSIIYFFRAHEVKPADIRPYIGLANAYRMKGMYFDSRRILDEARSKFRRDPNIEMGYIFLREER